MKTFVYVMCIVLLGGRLMAEGEAPAFADLSHRTFNNLVFGASPEEVIAGGLDVKRIHQTRDGMAAVYEVQNLAQLGFTVKGAVAQLYFYDGMLLRLHVEAESEEARALLRQLHQRWREGATGDPRKMVFNILLSEVRPMFLDVVFFPLSRTAAAWFNSQDLSDPAVKLDVERYTLFSR